MASRNLSNEASDESVQALIEAVEGNYDLPRRWYRLKARPARARPPGRLRPHGGGGQRGRRDRVGRREGHRAHLVRRLLRRSWARRRRPSSTSAGSTRPCARPSAAARSAPTPSRRVHPYLLLNYTSRRRDVLTLAHELGHGLHAALARAARDPRAAHAADAGRDGLRVRRDARLPPAARRGRYAGVAPGAAGREHRGLDRHGVPPDRDEPLRGPRPHRAPRRRAS